MKKILILFVILFSCVSCANYNSLPQDIIVTKIEYINMQENKCRYTIRFYNRDSHRYTGTVSFYGKPREYSCGDTLRLVKLNEK